MQVKLDCDKDPTVKPPVASTSECASPSANMDKSVQFTMATESDLNGSEVTFKERETVTYERTVIERINSPQGSKRKATIKLFDDNDRGDCRLTGGT